MAKTGPSKLSNAALLYSIWNIRKSPDFGPQRDDFSKFWPSSRFGFAMADLVPQFEIVSVNFWIKFGSVIKTKRCPRKYFRAWKIYVGFKMEPIEAKYFFIKKYSFSSTNVHFKLIIYFGKSSANQKKGTNFWLAESNYEIEICGV
jgi:hypothetical protein